MIYGRFGQEVEVVRVAILVDVKRLDHRKPDKADRDAIRNGFYVVIRLLEDKKEQLYHKGLLRADGGLREIDEAITRAKGEGVL